MKSHEFKELLDRYSRGECSPEEEKFVLDWYENIGGPQHERIKQDNSRFLEAKLWSKINPAHPDAGRNHAFYLTRIAASILLLAATGIGGYYFFSKEELTSRNIAQDTDQQQQDNTYTQLVNDTSRPREVTLEDGSRVTLEPKSEIRFANSFSSDKREVFLTGEAFFNVQRDVNRPFLVYSNEVVTKVLGTSFTIKAYQNEKEVTVAVKSGKVSVSAQRKEVILTPNQQVVFDRYSQKAVKQLVEEPEIILPGSNLFRMNFDSEPVTKIFEVLEENYGVDIVYNEETLQKCTLTTAMSDEGLYERIEVICKAIHAEYSVDEATIHIKSSGCE